MCNFEMEGSERVYKVAVLIFRGWKKLENEDQWIHPDGKKYSETISDNEAIEYDTWPFDEAFIDETQNESFW